MVINNNLFHSGDELKVDNNGNKSLVSNCTRYTKDEEIITPKDYASELFKYPDDFSLMYLEKLYHYATDSDVCSSDKVSLFNELMHNKRFDELYGFETGGIIEFVSDGSDKAIKAMELLYMRRCMKYFKNNDIKLSCESNKSMLPKFINYFLNHILVTITVFKLSDNNIDTLINDIEYMENCNLGDNSEIILLESLRNLCECLKELSLIQSDNQSIYHEYFNKICKRDSKDYSNDNKKCIHNLYSCMLLSLYKNIQHYISLLQKLDFMLHKYSLEDNKLEDNKYLSNLNINSDDSNTLKDYVEMTLNIDAFFDSFLVNHKGICISSVGLGLDYYLGAYSNFIEIVRRIYSTSTLSINSSDASLLNDICFLANHLCFLDRYAPSELVQSSYMLIYNVVELFYVCQLSMIDKGNYDKEVFTIYNSCINNLINKLKAFVTMFRTDCCIVNKRYDLYIDYGAKFDKYDSDVLMNKLDEYLCLIRRCIESIDNSETRSDLVSTDSNNEVVELVSQTNQLDMKNTNSSTINKNTNNSTIDNHKGWLASIKCLFTKCKNNLKYFVKYIGISIRNIFSKICISISNMFSRVYSFVV